VTTSADTLAPERRETGDRARPRIGLCYVLSTMLSDTAGTERHLLRVIRALNRRHFDPLLVVLQRSEFTDRFSDPEVPLETVGFRSFYLPWDWACIGRLARILRRHATRIVELHSPEGQLLGTLAARVAQVPVIVSSRRNLGYAYGWKERLELALTNRWITRFVANSQQVIREIGAKEKLSPSRFELIYNGVDTARFDREAVEPVPVFEHECRGRCVIAIAANLRPVKNLPLFLEAARQVAACRDNVMFAILGSGPDQTALSQLALRLGIADRVVWTGAVHSTAPYLVRSHIACLSSDSEGFSNAILEYMAAALPVVATEVGGAAEAIVEGETGYLVPARQPEPMARRLLQLLDAPPLRARMGRAGRTRVDDWFSLSRQIESYERLYHHLVRNLPE
jgi:glycosyltransferase involved in cell wall biosynthesis